MNCYKQVRLRCELIFALRGTQPDKDRMTLRGMDLRGKVEVRGGNGERCQ